jgi:hypothetical protein
MAATPTTSLSFQNFFQATLSSDITASAVDIPLDNIPNGSEGILVIDPDNEDEREVVYYTSKTALKVVCPSAADGRGQDDTTALPHTQGTTVIMAPVALYFETLKNLFTTSPQGWTSLSGAVSGVTYNGQRSYDITVDTDQTAVLSPGMRLRTTRTVSAPTQSTSLNGTNQYYSKSSPSGMTFTDDFVVSAWVKLTGYGTTGVTIASRYNGTSGWVLRVGALGTADGRVYLAGFNAGGSNYSAVVSYQSVPLNRWVHITAQLDMSSFTATTTTSYVMIDGVDVPATVVRGGTSPTALIQAGNLELGSENGGTSLFSGKIAQVAIYNAKVTQANIRATISQGLVGNETSLISAYSFSNSINDLNTTNANNLTAQGSAVATDADSPFGGQAGGTISSTLDYGIVAKVTASTVTVNVAEGCTIPTSGGVSSVSYSTYSTPYGFPGEVDKWRITYLNRASNSTTSNATFGTFMSGSWSFTVPVGAWGVGYHGDSYSQNVTISFAMSPTSLAGAGTTQTTTDITWRTLGPAGASTNTIYIKKPKVHSSAQTYVMYTHGASTSGGIDGANVYGCEMFAENAYL